MMTEIDIELLKDLRVDYEPYYKETLPLTAMKTYEQERHLAASLIDRQTASLDARDAEIAWLREALAFYAKDHKRPNEGPWGVNSRDFGDIARAALKASHDDPSDTQGGE